MFLKKYRVKSSTTIKGSERKRIRGMIEQQYPSLSCEDINLFISTKSDLSQAKVLVHNGAVVIIYYNGSNPIFFSVENKIFPTVYMLWKFPNLVPCLTTVSCVLEKFCNGADLMAPGVVVNDATKDEFQNLRANDVCSVRLEGNKAPVAVGVSLLHCSEVLIDGRKGKAVLIYHFYKDNLWASGDQTPLPEIPVSISCSDALVDNQDQLNENTIELSSPDIDSIEQHMTAVDLEHSVDCNVEVEAPAAKEEKIDFTMDEIVHQCFMLSLKAQGKKIPLPILTSTFYRTYVLHCCPPGLNFDIKKTTYKKLSVFLKSVSSSGLIEVKELTKGVESIVSINLEHELLKTFIPHPLFKAHFKQQKEDSIVVEPQVQEKYKFPEIVEMFVVSANVQQLFQWAKYRKGEALTAVNVRDILRNYVKENSLQDEKNPRLVTVDPILCSCLLKGNNANRSSLTWEELFDITLSRMSPAFTITFEGEEPKLKKGHIDPIDVSVATRTGNKKVTLVNNLENFGINPEKLANHVQVAVAASTSVGLTPNGKGTQVLIQGNQVRYLQSLFADKYKVPKKFLRGLDNVPAKKK